MSHFTVLVIGENVEQQLAPYHEFECTGTEEFIQDIDLTEEVRTEFTDERRQEYGSIAEFAMQWYGLPPLDIDNPLDLAKTHKFGYVRIVNGKLDSVVKRTNPNKKWDWWEIGGRWTGFWLAKPGATGMRGRPGVMTEPAEAEHFDSMYKGDIDFARMRSIAAEKAKAKWQQVHDIAAEHGGLPQAWSEFRTRFTKIDDARNAYHKLPVVQALNNVNAIPFMDDVTETYGCSLEAFMKRAADGAIATFAVLRDGRWYERGSMGWWGIVTDETMDKNEWSEKIAAMIEGLHDNTLLTVVDCHI